MRYLRHNGTHEKFDVFASDNIANDGRPNRDEDGRKQDLKDAHVVLTIVASNINAAYIFSEIAKHGTSIGTKIQVPRSESP